MVAHVHAEEVSGGGGAQFALGVFALRIEACGLVIMPVHRGEIPVVQFLALGVGIGNAAPHGLREQAVEGSDVGESAGTSEGFEKMARFDVCHPLVGMELEELMSGGGTAQTPQHAQLAIVDVGNIRAPVLA